MSMLTEQDSKDYVFRAGSTALDNSPVSGPGLNHATRFKRLPVDDNEDSTMISHPLRHKALASAILAAMALGGCGTSQPPSQPADATAAPSATAGKKRFHAPLDDHFAIDYELETRISTVDGKSCYTFITGSVTNQSDRTLSRRSTLDFIVIYKGKMLFRDITNPTADIPPGGSAMFTMVDSPVHSKYCPTYDRIDVSLRKVLED